MNSLVSVAVLGAGPAGSAVAYLLARTGVDVIVFERAGRRDLNRGEVLAGEGRTGLVQMGLWDRIPEAALRPCPSIQIAWGDELPRERLGITDPHGGGWQLVRPAFDEWMIAEAKRSGAIVARPVLVTSVRRGPSGWEVAATHGAERREIHARVLIDARGRSTTARTHGRATQRTRHDALCAFSMRGLELEDVAGLMVEATPDGWWYSLAAPEGGVMTTFLTDADLAAAYGRGIAVLRRALETAPLTSARVRLTQGPVEVVSACSASLTPAAGENWLAIGDAALARDPLSGEGITAAVGSAILASRAVEAHLGGDANALSLYGDHIRRRALEYLLTRRAIYNSERRWRERPFWRRRQVVGDMQKGRSVNDYA